MADYDEELLIDLDAVSVTAAPARTTGIVPRPAERKKLVGLDVDVYLLLVVGVLVAIGLMMVFSTTFDWSYAEFGSPSVIFFRQVRSLLIGLAVMGVLTLIDYRRWRLWIVPVTIAVIGLLVFLLTLPEHEEFGGRRALFGDSVQPGELAELVMIVYLSAWLSSKREKLRKLTYGLIPFSLLVGVVCALIMAQPDLSTAALIFVSSVTMFFLAGADLVQLALVGIVAGALGVGVATQIEYARVRIEHHLEGINQIQEASWHVQRATIAFRNGGWGGVGLGESSEKFGHLPFPHTDSIFAVIGEEMGIVGCVLVVALFVILVYRGFTIARRAPDAFGAVLSAGVSCWIVFQALLNMAVLTGLLPFTGVPLPFISYGGSSLVVSLAGMGLLLSVSRVTARNAIPERKSADLADIDEEDTQHDTERSTGWAITAATTRGYSGGRDGGRHISGPRRRRRPRR
ncbi:MAG: cell division protein FtsW [Anaerolineae bacterium]|nr:cell division protein FtsW [Anaerolineae bacterium]